MIDGKGCAAIIAIAVVGAFAIYSMGYVIVGWLP